MNAQIGIGQTRRIQDLVARVLRRIVCVFENFRERLSRLNLLFVRLSPYSRPSLLIRFSIIGFSVPT
ncbi:hypothetical protein [Sphingopyxis sp. P1IMeth2]|uniref:hypothetical protein n=1 Tax=Sphingopyxis sp. P1IMeth2 TaxID=1892848 RepID=UPI001646F96E|nr:hypothetical protein [Sphingopyxis sp. P1IMeth2]